MLIFVPQFEFMKNTTQREALLEEAMETGLTAGEFEKIKKILGRTPNLTETNIYGTIWSEHSSFKSAEKWLETLPKTKGDRGTVDLGNDLSCFLKIESNQQAESTLIGSQAIAQMNLLRFGNLDQNSTKTVIKEITKEISDSANDSGIPTFEGNVSFDDSFNDNPIVNTFSVGIIDSKKKTSAGNSKNTNQAYTYGFSSKKTIKSISEKLDLKAEGIKVVTDNKNVHYYYNEEIIAEIPVESLLEVGESPVKEREITEPAYFKESQKMTLNDIKEPDDLKEVALFLLNHPNIASKRWVNTQFNSMKRTGAKTTKAITGAGIVEIQGTNRALAMTVQCDSRYVNADPEIGTAIAVAEAARKIVCSGGKPIAISTCLNFGDANNPENNWQFVNAIKGMSAACLKFNTPVASENVEFYNQSKAEGAGISIFPTPTIGMVGLLEDKDKAMSLDFKHKGDLIFIIGEATECIASSEYLYSYHGVKSSPAPYFNLNREFDMQEVIKSIIQKDLVNAVHDCSKGGIFIALTEMAMPNELGFDIVTDAEIREDAFLFGEATGRVLVGVNEESEEDFIEFMMHCGVNFTLLGHVTQGKMVVDDDHFGFIQAAKKSYDKALGDLIDF